MEFPLLDGLACVLAIAYLIVQVTSRPFGNVSKTRGMVFILLDIALIAVNYLTGNWFLFILWFVCLIVDSLATSDVS